MPEVQARAAAPKAPSFQEALTGSPPQLQGVPTYKLPHHPAYYSSFSSPAYLPLWSRACGNECYTRLVRGSTRAPTSRI
jgi:hypothetical protein